jgi:hypothetical protein
MNRRRITTIAGASSIPMVSRCAPFSDRDIRGKRSDLDVLAGVL